MTARTFTINWSIAIALLFAMLGLFPFLLSFLVRNSGCQGIGGACGATAAVYGMLLRMPLVYGVGIFLGVIGWKRARAINFSPYGFLLIITFYVAIVPFLLAFGNFWGANMGMGIVMTGNPLPFLIALIGTLLALTFLPMLERPSIKRPTTISTLLSGAILMFFSMAVWPMVLTQIPFVGRAFWSISWILASLPLKLRFIFGDFALLLTSIVYSMSLILWIRQEKRRRFLHVDPAISL